MSRLVRVPYPALARSERDGAAVRLIVVHPAMDLPTYSALGMWLGTPAAGISVHVGIDATPGRIGEYVPPGMAAWANRSYNREAVTAGLCLPSAALRWDAPRWYGQAPLGTLAEWIAEEAARFRVPLRVLTAEEAQGGAAGICQHGDLAPDHRTAPYLPLDTVVAEAGRLWGARHE